VVYSRLVTLDRSLAARLPDGKLIGHPIRVIARRSSPRLGSASAAPRGAATHRDRPRSIAAMHAALPVA
jgi:hypothetical protein